MKLGELIDIKHGRAFSSEYFCPEGPYVLLTPGNFYETGGYKSKSDQKQYDGPVPEAFVLKPGDLLVAMTEQGEGLLGSAAFVPEGKPCLHNQRLGLVSAKDDVEVDLSYVYYVLNWRDVRQQIRGSATGAKIRHTSSSRIAAVEIPPHTIDTQRRIASILGAYDDLIEVNRLRVAVLEEMTQGLFEEWFVRFRFPGNESIPLVETPVGPLPRGWSMVTIADVAETNRASLRPQAAPERIGYIDIASVSPGQIDAVTWMDFSEAPGRARRLVQDGSILWSNVRPNRRSHAVVLAPADGTVASTGFTVLDAQAIPFTYLYQWVVTENFVGYLVGNATGAAYPKVTASTFERAPVLLPEGAVLGRFNALAEPLMRQEQVLRQANERLAATRDLLLPRLISGELSLDAAERALELAA